jgi:beta-galactosidase
MNDVYVDVFWNIHEKERGTFTFTEESDIFRFLQLAHHYELMVMLRLGPYICAETSYGGFPYWLKEIPGTKNYSLHKIDADFVGRYLISYLQ